MNPFFAVDGYKVFHHLMTPEGTTIIYSNLTPRSNKYAPKGCDKALVFGIQMATREIVENFNENFFRRFELEEFYADKQRGRKNYNPEYYKKQFKDKVCGEIKKEFSQYSGTDYDVSHIEALWNLGYLPVQIKSLPEGTFCPMGVPVLTIVNTHPDFAWVTNFLETMLSNLIWKPITSATLAYEFKKLNDKWINKTDEGNDFHSDFGCHDFSMRGMDSIYATMSSGLGHALSFKGSDSLPVIHAARKFYDEKGFVIGSIPATEHSIQCAYYNGSDYDYVKEIITRFSTGPVGIVSDGYDLWKLITEVLPKLKDQIMSRTGGPVVIRPDSGDPVDIICGLAGRTIGKNKDILPINVESGKKRIWQDVAGTPSTEMYKGVIELLWDIFGGTTNKQGYKVLHPSIKMIYGDAINLERFEEINTRLEAKGFASTNWVAGIGSFTYQFNTRDTFGIAVKATYVEINGEGKEIFKDPITDDGTKKSAKGLLTVEGLYGGVYGDAYGDYVLHDKVSWKFEKQGFLKIIFKDGKFYNQTTLEQIRKRLR